MDKLGKAPMGYVRIHAKLSRDEALRRADDLRTTGRAACLVRTGDRFHVYAKAVP